jgi:hypothetical protein
MTEKRFQYNVNKNTIEQDGKHIAYVNSIDGVRIANKLNILQNENEQLKKEINMLKTTIGRNEAHIQQMKHKGEWK